MQSSMSRRFYRRFYRQEIFTTGEAMMYAITEKRGVLMES